MRISREFLRLACALAALALAGCAKPAPEPEAHEHDEHVEAGPHGGAVVTLTPEAIEAGGIAIDSARARTIEVTAELPGEIKLDGEHSVDVRPTYAGTVRELKLPLGAWVTRGQPLAVIHSNESLSDYTVSAPMSGAIVARPANPGATVDAGTLLYTIANLGTVWLDFPIYMQHLGRIRRGQTVHVRSESGAAVTGAVHYVGPLLDTQTRTTFGRVVLPNRDHRWQPGGLATAIVVLERVMVPIAVPEDAIVRMGSGSGVFLADTSRFELVPVTIGRTDGVVTEIVSGVDRDARIATRNAFLLKAELEKEAGGHDD